jgi:hypothetical protein
MNRHNRTDRTVQKIGPGGIKCFCCTPWPRKVVRVAVRRRTRRINRQTLPAEIAAQLASLEA